MCTLPLTGKGVVSTIITDLAVFDIGINGLVLREIVAGTSVEELRLKTAAKFTVHAGGVTKML